MDTDEPREDNKGVDGCREPDASVVAGAAGASAGGGADGVGSEAR